MKSFTVEIPNFPESDLPLGQWMDRNGAELSLSCTLGTFHAQVSWGILHSYSDGGEHRETFLVRHSHKDPAIAITKALEAAFEQDVKRKTLNSSNP